MLFEEKENDEIQTRFEMNEATTFQFFFKNDRPAAICEHFPDLSNHCRQLRQGCQHILASHVEWF